jgi:hypothetical protein
MVLAYARRLLDIVALHRGVEPSRRGGTRHCGDTMKSLLFAVALSVLSAGAMAQQVQGQSSHSTSDANSSSASQAGSASNQAQQANNAGNVQGVVLNSAPVPTRTTTDFKTNNSVPLVAAVSFSSDYCGGTASGGASGAGWSVGVSKPLMDRNCQAIRRAQTFGMLSANARNLGNLDQANKLMALSIYEICESGIGDKETFTQSACLSLGLVVAGHMDPAPALQDVNPRAEVTDPVKAQQVTAEAQAQQAQAVTIRDDRGNTTTAAAAHH